MKEEILFKSKRYVEYSRLLVLGTSIAFALFLLIYSVLEISNWPNNAPKKNQKDIHQKEILENRIIRETEDQFNIMTKELKYRNITPDSSLYQLIYEQTKERIESQNRDITESLINVPIFFGLFAILFLYLATRNLLNYFYRNKVSFYITGNYISIRRFWRREKILCKDIETITLLGEKNLVGYFYNKDLSAILIKTKNDMKNSFILVDRFSYENLCELVDFLKSMMTDKVIINKVKVDKVKRAYGFIFAILFNFLIAIKVLYVYGFLAFIGLVIFAVIMAKARKPRRNKISCPELFEEL